MIVDQHRCYLHRQELKEASSNDLKSFLGLAYNLERLKALFGVTMESLLSEAMPSVAMRHIKGRLDKTIDCCGFSSIASSLAARFRANSDLLEEILQPLLSPARFDQSHRELRNLFRGVLKASDPEVSQRLVEIIDETVVVPRIYRALEQVLDGTVRTAMQSPGDLAKALVLELAKLRSIFGNDLFGDRRTALAMERALLTISVRLGPVEANRLGDFLAHILRWISNGNGAESGMMLSQAEGELLVGAIKVGDCRNDLLQFGLNSVLAFVALDACKQRSHGAYAQEISRAYLAGSYEI